MNDHAGTILIIEDDPITRDLVKMILKRMNAGETEKFGIIAAYDGVEGLEVLRQNPQRLILLDILLPNMNGLDFLKQAKSEGLLEATPVIVISALGYREIVQQALGAGATDFVVKPFSSDRLVERVKRALAGEEGLSDESSAS